MRASHGRTASGIAVLALVCLGGCHHTIRGVCVPPVGTPAVAVQMDPTWDALDPNGLPLAPRWNVQSPTGSGALCLPDPEEKDVCSGFPKAGGVPHGSPACSRTARAEAPLEDVVHGWVCNTGRGLTRFAGHLNFLPATYVGFIYYQGHSFPDDDLDFELLPIVRQADGWVLKRTGLTANRPLDPGLEKRPAIHSGLSGKGLDHVLHVEAKAGETLERFDRPGWRKLLGGGAAQRRSNVAGLPAVATGLLGLDAEHGAFSELHPAHALAIQTQCAETSETWQVFVRTAGNQGWCSQWDLPHLLEPPLLTFAIALPTSGTVTRAEIASSDLQASLPGVTGPALSLEQGSLVLRFRWPDEAREDPRALLHGEVRIARAGGTCLDLGRVVEASPSVPKRARKAAARKDAAAEGLLLEMLGPRAAAQAEALPHDAEPSYPLAAPAAGDSLFAPPPSAGEGAPCPGGAGQCVDTLRARVADRTPVRDAGKQAPTREDERLCGALADSKAEAASDPGRARQVQRACQEWLRTHQ